MKKVLLSLAVIFVTVLGTNKVVAQEVTNGAQIKFAKD